MGLRGFYFITDRRLSTKGDVEAVKDAIAGGARVVQYREKGLGTREMIDVACRMRELTRGKAVFLVNDRVDVALAAGADGVHLGQDDMRLADARKILGDDSIIGVTVHNLREALEAEAGGADYVGVSPVFATKTKEDAGEPAGVTLVREVKAKVGIPVAAIGGISEDNVDPVIEAGADMVCAISATVMEEDIRAAVQYFASKFMKE